MYLMLLLLLLLLMMMIINGDDDDAVGKVSQGVWSGANLSLCAVNLGNVAGHALSTDRLAEMYAVMAMTIRLYLPRAFHFLVVSCIPASDFLIFTSPVGVGCLSVVCVGVYFFVCMLT